MSILLCKLIILAALFLILRYLQCPSRLFGNEGLDTMFKNAADFAETMEMLEEYNYLRRETIQGANGNNKSGIMVFINPNI